MNTNEHPIDHGSADSQRTATDRLSLARAIAGTTSKGPTLPAAAGSVDWEHAVVEEFHRIEPSPEATAHFGRLARNERVSRR